MPWSTTPPPFRPSSAVRPTATTHSAATDSVVDVSGRNLDGEAVRAVQLVAACLHDDVVALLRPVAVYLGETLVLQSVRRTITGGKRERRWEMSWEVVSCAGRTLRVSIQALVSVPSVLAVVIDGTAVYTCGVGDASPLPKEAAWRVLDAVRAEAALLYARRTRSIA